MDLLRLRSATNAYLAIVRDVAPALEEVERLGELRDHLAVTLREDEQGTPAAIAAVLRRLLGAEDAPHEAHGPHRGPG